MTNNFLHAGVNSDVTLQGDICKEPPPPGILSHHPYFLASWSLSFFAPSLLTSKAEPGTQKSLEKHLIGGWMGGWLTLHFQWTILSHVSLQLRTRANVYDLAKNFNLEVSLFERLVKVNIPFVRLNYQVRS